MKKISIFPTVFTLLFCFSQNVTGQGWELLYSDPTLVSSYNAFACPAANGGVRLVANDDLAAVPSEIVNFDKNGNFINKTTIPGTNGWQCFNADNDGATYWVDYYKVKKYNADYQLEWTYTAPSTAGIFWETAGPNGKSFLYYSTDAGKEVIDMLGADGQLLNVYDFGNWTSLVDTYWPGDDNSIIYTTSDNSSGLTHYIKLDQNSQTVWERDFESTDFFFSGSVEDGSTFFLGQNGLTKLSPNGNFEWAKDPQDYFPINFFASITQMMSHSDGSIVLFVDGFNVDTSEETPYFAKIDASTGNLIWVKPIQSKPDAGFLYPYKLFEMEDGGILTSAPIFNNVGDFDNLILRTDYFGNTLSNLITGNLFLDNNNDCADQPAELPMSGISVIATSGTKAYSSTTDATGHFEINVSVGDHSISFGQLGQYWNTCNTGIVSLTANDTAHLEIGAKPTILCPDLAISLGSPVFRRCFDNNYLTVSYQNIGTVAPQNSYVDITLDPKLIYQSSTVPLLSQNGQVFRFGLGEIGIGAGGNFKIFLKVDCDATMGELLCASGHIYPDTSCLPTAAAVFENPFCLPAVASFDPNDKTAFIKGRPESAKIQPDSSLEYLIRFQNTGTDTAFNIVVVDTLTALLDAASVLPGAASHPYSFELKDGRILRFSFKNILLPDSTTDEVGSHGFVKFSVRQAAGNPLGATIQNRAAIFFDYNLPVITNQTALVVTKQVRTLEPKSAREAKIWPIPASDRVEILLENAAAGPIFWKMMDATGRVVRMGEEAGNSFGIERRGLPGGAYFLLFLDKNGVSTAGKTVFD